MGGLEATKECGGVLCKGGEVDPALVRDRLGWNLLRTFLTIVRHLPDVAQGTAPGARRSGVSGAFPAIYGAVFAAERLGDVVNAPLAALRAPVG